MPDLTSGLDLTQAAILNENAGLAFMGDTKVGPFEIDAEQAIRMIAAVGNPNGRSNSEVVRPWVNGMDVTRRSRNMWIVDFGTDMTEAAAAQYEVPFEYIRKHVKPFRATAKSGDCIGVPWWLHQRPRPDMRTAISKLKQTWPHSEQVQRFAFASSIKENYLSSIRLQRSTSRVQALIPKIF